MGLGFIATRLFKLPSWVTPALCFNNTTSLPLLLIESLETTGILEVLVVGDGDSTASAVLRAKSYLLINSIVSNSMTFALGAKLLDEEESEQDQEAQRQANGGPAKPQQDAGQENNNALDEEAREQNEDINHNNQRVEEVDVANEQTSLLPEPVIRRGQQVKQVGYDKGKYQWDQLPSWLRSCLGFCYSFLNAPLVHGIH